jgi:hypothetical protein
MQLSPSGQEFVDTVEIRFENHRAGIRLRELSLCCHTNGKSAFITEEQFFTIDADDYACRPSQWRAAVAFLPSSGSLSDAGVRE